LDAYIDYDAGKAGWSYAQDMSYKPQFLTYRSEAPTPDGRDALCAIWGPLGWHPVIFRGTTLEAAERYARAWWDEELAKAERREASLRKATQATVEKAKKKRA